MAVPRSQHSPMLGQAASWQTVCRPWPSIMPAQLAVARAARRRELEPRAACARGTAAPRPSRAPGRRPGSARERVLMRRRTVDATCASSRSGDTRRWRARAPRRSGSAIALAEAGAWRRRAPVSRRPRSSRTWSIPQGTIHSNGWRSLSTFTAKPCVVTPRRTCTPIEPILRVAGPDAGHGPRARRPRCPRRPARRRSPRSIVRTKSAHVARCA